MNTMVQNFNLVLFGGTGDLVTRKIIPALYDAFITNKIPKESKILTLGRRDLSKEDYCNLAYKKAIDVGISLDDKEWQNFCNLINYVKLDANNHSDFTNLAKQINNDITTIYYLSTEPSLFQIICNNIAKAKLNHKNSRIVLEKPLGHDLESSNEINDFVAQVFSEQQIYRIDHYLGKESVQNLMAIRFGNTLFEALWRRQWIESIQITIAEDLGVGERSDFYNKTGALRDMLQNHLLQLLCIVAMEPPASLEADTVRNEKLKVLQSLKPLTRDSVLADVVRGQYKSGEIKGHNVKGYLEEDGVPKDSMTETFVAMKVLIENWRWANVPFYLRTGKRMANKFAEIVIQFKDIPCKIFPFASNNNANRLIIKLQPDETVQLYFLAKNPGDTNELRPVYLDLDFNKMLPSKRTDGYERLLLDAIKGNLTLFVSRKEQEAAWKWVEPIMTTWDNMKLSPKLYTSGSWGPASSTALLARDGSSWHEELE